MRYTKSVTTSSALPYKFYKDSGWGDESGYASIRDALEAAVSGTPYLRIGQQRWTQGDPEEYRYFIWRGTCRFSITDPGITILEVKLGLRLDHKQGSGFDITIRNGMPDYPHYPAVIGDYYRGHYTISEGSINTAGWVSGEDRDVIISNSAIQISTYDEHRDLALGTYMLMSSNDVSGIAPITYEYLALIRRPRLSVQYSFDLVAVTDLISNIACDKCKIKGTSISSPNDGWTEFGFEYYKEGDEGNVQKKYSTGSIWNQYFHMWLTGLESGTTYFVRTYLKSEEEECWAYGEWVEFKTICCVTSIASITTKIEVNMFYGQVATIKAYKSGVFTRMELTGEIIEAVNIFKRGFEYIIQDNQPEEEAEGTKIIEESEEAFGIGKYKISDYDKDLPLMYRNPLYQLEEDTIFWFRAIIYLGEKKETGNWMKNVPTVIINAVSPTIFTLIGECNLTDLGANIVTKRGIRIVTYYTGNLFINDIWEYRLQGFSIYSKETRNVYAPNGVLIGFECDVVFEKYKYQKKIYGFEIGEYETDSGDLVLGSNYDIYAYAENNLGRGFSEKININAYPIFILVDDGGETSPYTKIENIRVMNVPDGYEVTRIGKRWGRTRSCNEGEIYEDGRWNNGDTITFFIVDLIPDTKYYFDIYYILERIPETIEIKDVNGKVDISTDIINISIDNVGGLIKSESGKVNINTDIYLENNLRMTFYNVSGKVNISSSIWLWWIWKEFDYFGEPIFNCINEGISGEEKPDWPKESGREVIDGSVTWICEEGSRGGLPDWQALTAYKIGDYVKPSYFSFSTPEDPEYPDGLPDIEIPSFDLVGIDYETVIKEIKCSIIADQSIIDKYGRKRTLTINNSLIQTMEFCKSIRDNYLNRFQILKLKIEIDYDIPLPFEREDTILLAYGQINYKTDSNGVIGAKADGEGIIDGKMSILTKIRKINMNAKEGEAISTLELEV